MCSGFPSSCFISLTCNVWMSYCWGSFRVLLDGMYIMANALVLFATQTHCPFLFSYDLGRKKREGIFNTVRTSCSHHISPSFAFGTGISTTKYRGSLDPNPCGISPRERSCSRGSLYTPILQRQKCTMHRLSAVPKPPAVGSEFGARFPEPRPWEAAPPQCCVSTARQPRANLPSQAPAAL